MTSIVTSAHTHTSDFKIVEINENITEPLDGFLIIENKKLIE